MSKMLIDIGSTYFKLSSNGNISHHFRNFDKDIHDDLIFKCGDEIDKYSKDDIHICSSANGGLSTLIIGLTESFSLKFASNIAYNSGINIIETVIYSKIEDYAIPSDALDVVIVVGGIDSVKNIFDEKLINYLDRLNYSNIVYVGSSTQIEFLKGNIPNLVVLPNIIDNKLYMNEDELKRVFNKSLPTRHYGKRRYKTSLWTHFKSDIFNSIYCKSVITIYK